MDSARRQELRALCAKATPGPWMRERCLDGEVEIVAGPDRSPLARYYGDDFDDKCWPVASNALFTATARTAVPELLDALDAAEKPCVWTRLEAGSYTEFYGAGCGDHEQIGKPNFCPHCGHPVLVKEFRPCTS